MAKRHAQPQRTKRHRKVSPSATSSQTDLSPRARVAGGDDKAALLSTTLSNLMQMQHETLKAVAQNLRA